MRLEVRCRGRKSDGEPCRRLFFVAVGLVIMGGQIEIICSKCGKLNVFVVADFTNSILIEYN